MDPPDDDEKSPCSRPSRTEAQNIADDIARHTLLLASLYQKQKVFADFKHTLFAPIRRLPLEVLQSIFLLCLPKDHNPSLASQEAPFLLCHVCRRWRNVVFRTSLLWTRLHVHIPIFPEVPISYRGLRSSRDAGQLLDRDQLTQDEIDLYENAISSWTRKMGEYTDAISSWLTRASKCPLDISLQQSPNVSDSSNGREAQDKIVQVVCSFSDQWKTLQIHAPMQVVAAVLNIAKDRLSALEKVAVQWNISCRERIESVDDLESATPDIRIFRATNFKRLSLQNIPYPLRVFPIHWERLTELILGGFAEPNRNHSGPRPVLLPSRVLDILERCPNLVRCRLTLGKTYARQVGPTVPIFAEGETRERVQLPHLECLSINEGNPLHDFFTYLELPSLKEFIFKTSQYPRTDRRSVLIPLFQRYGDNFRKVILDDAMLSVDDLEEIFRLLPNLTDLKLNRPSYIRTPYDRASPSESNFVVGYLSPNIWDGLTPRIPEPGAAGSSHDLLLPNLLTFSCRVHAPELIQDKIIGFVRARRHPSLLNSGGSTPLLQKFGVTFYSMEPEHRYKNMAKELGKLGTDVMQMAAFEVKHRRTYGDSLLGSNDFVVRPLLRPKWPTTGDKPGVWFGVEDIYEEDE